LFIKIRQLYDTLPFDDPNGGVWKQGFDIEYDQSQWTVDNKLKVILMPHSHCDPGITKRSKTKKKSEENFISLSRMDSYIRSLF
jgi:alpha-mannosidase II